MCISLKNNPLITDCSATTYGENCANTCECIDENSAGCDNVDGTCTCKPGFHGNICQAGIFSQTFYLPTIMCTFTYLMEIV